MALTRSDVPAGSARADAWRRRRESLARTLFAAAPRVELTRRRIGWAAAGFVATIALAASRTGGGGAFNSIWIEDAKRFLTTAFNEPTWEALSTPFNGYFHVGPRIMAEAASSLPVRWSAPALTLCALIVLATFASVVYAAAGAYFRQVWLRVLVALPVVAFPVGHTQADNDVATLQFPALYALFWVFLWRPHRRSAKVLAVVIAGYATLSSILPAVLLPLLVLRLLVTRDRLRFYLAGSYATGLLLQLSGLITGATSRDGIGTFRPDPVWVVKSIVTRLVPRAIFGEKALGGPGTGVDGKPRALDISNYPLHVMLIVAAWLVVAGIILVALRRLTDPHWPLAALAAGTAVALFSVAIVDMGIVQPRYVIPGVGLLYTAGLALLRPRPAGAAGLGPTSVLGRLSGARWAIAFAVLASIAMVANLRGENGRSRSLPWDQIVAEGEARCADPAATAYEYQFTWWYVRIPCDRLR